jgi:signal transduction histidine kinase
MLWSLYPVWIVDFLGSVAMIVFAWLSLMAARTMHLRDRENPFANYILWFCAAIFAFSASRSLAHMGRHILYFSGHGLWWDPLAPFSGSINSIIFVVIGAITLFFNRSQAVMNRMARDREKIERTSRELLRLNKDIEGIVSERTRAELALRVAHEIRNPIMIIGGLIRLLKKEGLASDQPVKERFEKVLDQARNLEEFLSRFDAAGPDVRRQFSPQELNSVVEETLETVKQDAEEKGIVLLLDRSAAHLSFQGNRHLIKAALVHVLRNAIEACGPGNTLEVDTKLAANGVMVAVKDNGPGIPEGIVGRIFGASSGREEGGTGLGLRYVRQIIEEHRGEIKISSAKGKGTTVEILLPTHIAELQEDHAGR